ncbi:MAG TPA: response regulator [Hyphomonadaceae bacterium]|nr:response regulator [Hyphomonadaceae bacterium]
MDRMLERVKMLIVDDNLHMIHVTKTILRGFGIKDFQEAANAHDAFELVKKTAFDLIITDYAMSPVDGCEFTKRLRTATDSPNHFVPIIMLTAYADKATVEAARDAGVTEFCAKPITATDLYRKVCSVINSPRSFVRTSVYFGPDRRRRAVDDFKGAERREAQSGPKGSTIPNNAADTKPADPVT